MSQDKHELFHEVNKFLLGWIVWHNFMLSSTLHFNFIYWYKCRDLMKSNHDGVYNNLWTKSSDYKPNLNGQEKKKSKITKLKKIIFIWTSLDQ